jgi:hypothetical protein
MSFIRLLLVLLFCAGPATAADLSKIDRTIAKEPKYQSKPKYCLLVFGSEAKTRVWLVLDGDVLYVDRNADGDLTVPEDRLKRNTDNKVEGGPIAQIFAFSDLDSRADKENRRNVPLLTGTKRYTHLSVEQLIPRDDYRPKTPEQREAFTYLKRNFVGVEVLIDGRVGQQGRAVFSSDPQNAPILHFGGPMRPAITKEFVFLQEAEPPNLVRGEKPLDLKIRLITPGLGDKDTVTVLEVDSPPANAHPVAEVEFPAKQPGEKTIKARYVLGERC